MYTGDVGGGLVLAAISWSAGTLVCGCSLVSLPALALLDYTLLCLRRLIRHACTGIPLDRWAPVGSWLLRVFFGVLCLLWFFVLRVVFGGPGYRVAFTHLPCLMAFASHVCGGRAGGGGRALLVAGARSVLCFLPRSLRTSVPSPCNDAICSQLVLGLLPIFFLHRVFRLYLYHGRLSLCLQYYIYLNMCVYSGV